ncbi:MAG: hypothetical protein ACRD1X_13530 [Vicinamibacteria bacterium]
MKLDVKGGGPNWVALVRRSDRQIMIAFAGNNEAALGMVEIFLKAAGRRIPRSDLILVELNAQFQIVEATDIWARFKIFEAKRDADRRAEEADEWIRRGKS